MSLADGVLNYDDGTASKLAFTKTFRVGVQNKFLRTPEIIHWMGTPTTGNRTLDRRLQENFVEIIATPIACVEYYLMGAPIRFRNAAIPNQILNILRQHVKNWDYIINEFYNVEPPPMEELDDIMEFCDLIMHYAGAGKQRDQSWLLGGKRLNNGSKPTFSPDAIGSKRRKIDPGSDECMDTKSSTDIRAEKMMNFRKNFAKQRGESTS